MTLSAFFAANWPLFGLLIILIVATMVFETLFAQNRFALPTNRTIEVMNRKKSLILDLRDKSAFEQGHIAKAQRFDRAQIIKNPEVLKKHKSAPIVVICERGLTAQKVAAFLQKQGFSQAHSLAGGMQAWRKEKLPTTTE
jgi:rhodanese-related sulfurtransferase